MSYKVQELCEEIAKLKAELERIKQDDAERCTLIRDMEDDERRREDELERVKVELAETTGQYNSCVQTRRALREAYRRAREEVKQLKAELDKLKEAL